MMRFSIITTEFFSFSDPAKGVKFHPVFEHPHEGIGSAGVIDEPQVSGVGRGIQCKVVVEFDQIDHFQISDQPSGFPHRDEDAAEITDLTLGRDTGNRIGPFSGDAAFGNADRV